MIKNNRAVTILELLVVILVLGVIAGISIPLIGNLINNSKIKADQATVVSLNQATKLFLFTNSENLDFSNPSSNSETLIELLYNQGFISHLASPQSKEGSFDWDVVLGLWLFNGQYIVSSIDGLNYDSDFYAGEGRLVGPYTGTKADIVIPDIIDGNVIIRIWQDAFRYDPDPDKYSLTQLKSVIFTSNSSIEIIHARAFQNNDISEIAFPDSLKEIHLRAFFGNNNLTKITIGSNITKIEDNAFLGNNLFKDAYFEHGAGVYLYTNGAWIKQ